MGPGGLQFLTWAEGKYGDLVHTRLIHDDLHVHDFAVALLIFAIAQMVKPDLFQCLSY